MKSLAEAVESRGVLFSFACLLTTACKILLGEDFHNFTSLPLPLLFVALSLEVIHW